MVFKDQVDHFLKVVDLSGISPNFRVVYPKKYYPKREKERERERERERRRRRRRRRRINWGIFGD